MKHKIIFTKDYLLVVDDSEIKKWYYDSYTNKVKHSGGAEYGENSITKNILAHLQLNDSPILQGVHLLPPLEQENDVEKIPTHFECEMEIKSNTNQCDGCKSNIPITNGVHFIEYPSGPMVCQATNYSQAKTTINSQGQTVLIGKYGYNNPS